MSTGRFENDTYEPLEARGEDPEIDMKATEQAFYHEPEARGESRIRRLSETVIEAFEAAAEKIAEGSRKISAHVVEDGQTMASALFGGAKGE